MIGLSNVTCMGCRPWCVWVVERDMIVWVVDRGVYGLPYVGCGIYTYGLAALVCMGCVMFVEVYMYGLSVVKCMG